MKKNSDLVNDFSETFKVVRLMNEAREDDFYFFSCLAFSLVHFCDGDFFNFANSRDNAVLRIWKI